jgi:hypothetical protein
MIKPITKKVRKPRSLAYRGTSSYAFISQFFMYLNHEELFLKDAKRLREWLTKAIDYLEARGK